MRISQSLLKDFKDYRDRKLCGLLFQALWIDRSVEIEPTEAMLMGQFFEYLALGRDAEPKFKHSIGDHFMIGMKASGKKNLGYWDEELVRIANQADDPENRYELKTDLFMAERDWTVKWFNLIQQATNLRAAFGYYGVEVLDVQKKYEYVQDDVTRVMKIDVLAAMHDYRHPDEMGMTRKLDEVIIDTKATGLINDKWQDYGWALHSLEFKDKLMIQPIDYKSIWKHLNGENIPFFFFVHANTNAVERKIVQVNVTDSIIQAHEEYVKDVVEQIDFFNMTRWIPYPEVEVCHECPLKETCKEAIDHPRIRVISLM